MKTILLLFLCVLSLGVAAAEITELGLEDVVGMDQPFTVRGERVLLMTHASPVYDWDEQAREGIEAIYQYARKTGIPQVYFLVHPVHLARQYIKLYEGTTIVHSPAGYHRGNFPEAREFLIAGGHYNFCSCLSVRDVLLSILDKSEKDPITFNYLMDAVYFSPKHTAFADEIGVHEGSLNLLYLHKRFNDTQFFNFIRAEYFDNHEGEEGMCQYNHDRSEKIHQDDFHFQVRRYGRVIGEFGDPKGRLIILNFTDTRVILQAQNGHRF